MKRKFIVAILSGAIVLNSSLAIEQVYAIENNGVDTLIENQDTKSTRVIYLENGEGNESSGNGSIESPYQNIRTALKNINDGDTLKLIGEVKFWVYESHTDNSALPLFIDKNITIEGATQDSGLLVRSTIQLGADVTFKDMRLQIMPQVIIGRNSNEKILGQAVERDTTIFTAGHKLTIDNVNTKVGTSAEQDDHRPFISSGTYKGVKSEKIGEKSVINIINPNKETRITAIYAGDYWDKLDMDVEINLDANLVDTTIYTGGVKHPLNGDVSVNLYGKTNVRDFDTSNHNGKLNVKLADGYTTSVLNVNGINELVLGESSRLTMASNKVFNANNVTLNSKAVIDFRSMESSPVVKGNFYGVQDTSDLELCGAIILNNNQTLDIKGEVSGLTRLNTNGVEYISRFKDGHEYVRASANSKGNFSIDGTTYTDFELNTEIVNNTKIWRTDEVENLSIFGSFRWVNGQDKIIKPEIGNVYTYSLEFFDKDNNLYKPDTFELLYDFEYTLKRADGGELDTDFTIFTDWNYDKSDSEDMYELNELKLEFLSLDNVYGDLILTVTHLETGDSISKTITVLEEDIPEIPEETPDQNPDTDVPGNGGTEEGTPEQKPDTDVPGNGGTEEGTPEQKPDTDVPGNGGIEEEKPDQTPDIEAPDNGETEEETPDQNPDTDVPGNGGIEEEKPDQTPDIEAPDNGETEEETPDQNPDTDVPGNGGTEEETPEQNPDTDVPGNGGTEEGTPEQKPDTDVPGNGGIEEEKPDQTPDIEAPDNGETEEETPDQNPDTDVPGNGGTEEETPEQNPDTDVPGNGGTEEGTPEQKPDTDVPGNGGTEEGTPEQKPDTDVPGNGGTEEGTPDQKPDTDVPGNGGTEGETPEQTPDTDAPGDNGDLSVNVDKNNLKPIEILGMIIKDTELKNININGTDFRIVYLDENGNEISRIRTSLPIIYVQGEKVIIPVESLEYIGLETKTLDINITLADGTVTSKTVALNVVEEDSNLPGGDINNGNTGDSNEDKKEESNSNNNNNNNSNNNNNNNELPQTGVPVNPGIVGGLLMFVGGLLTRKKK